MRARRVAKKIDNKEKSQEWGEIIEYSNWCYIDQLHGDNLEDGEWLRVRWPDGTESLCAVGIEESSCNVSEQGSPHGYNCPIRKAYVTTMFRGVSVRVPLKGLMARRVSKEFDEESSL